MVSGLGVLATTVGGTLDRSYEERILYEVAADVRVTGIPTYFTRGTRSIKERYLDIPGVSAVALALARGRNGRGDVFGQQLPRACRRVQRLSIHELVQIGFLRASADAGDERSEDRGEPSANRVAGGGTIGTGVGAAGRGLPEHIPVDGASGQQGGHGHDNVRPGGGG